MAILRALFCINWTGLPHLEKSGKNQGKVREEKFYEKVREKSGKKFFEVQRHFIEKFEKADLGLKTLV